MKNRTTIIIVFFIFIFLNSFAQTNLEYKRNTITPVLLIDESNTTNKAQLISAFSQMKVPDKFFCNTISNNLLSFNNSVQENDLQEKIKNDRIPAKSLNIWRTNQTIFDRAKYGLEENEIEILNQTQRKLESKVKDERWFKDFVFNTYIVVFKINGIYEKDEEYKKGLFGNVEAYLYKINLDEPDYNTFIKNWIPDGVQNDDYNYEIKFISKITVKCEGVEYKEESKKTQNELYLRLVNNAINEALIELGYKYESFLLKNEVIASNPIRSKIGKKESVTPNQLFFMYNRENGKWKKTGTVRAKKVADNRKIAMGDVEPTIFYPVHWGRYGKNAEGSLLSPKKDLGTYISFGSVMQPTQGFKLNFAQRVHKLLNTSDMLNLKIYIEGNVLNGLKDNNPFFDDIGLKGKNNLLVYNIGLGLCYDFFILGGVQLSPFLGYYIENATYKNRADINKAISPNEIPMSPIPFIKKSDYGQISYLNFGVRLPINLTYNIKVVPSYAYSSRNYNKANGVAFYANNKSYPQNMIIVKNNSFFDISLQVEF